METRKEVINAAIEAFDQSKTDVLRSLRLVFVDQALRSEGLELMGRDEIAEVNAAVEVGELPYRCDCAGSACQRCRD